MLCKLAGFGRNYNRNLHMLPSRENSQDSNRSDLNKANEISNLVQIRAVDCSITFNNFMAVPMQRRLWITVCSKFDPRSLNRSPSFGRSETVALLNFRIVTWSFKFENFNLKLLNWILWLEFSV